MKCTVPEYVVSTLFAASSAFTVKLIGAPVFEVAAAVTEKCVAADWEPPPPPPLLPLPAAPPPQALHMQMPRMVTKSSAFSFMRPPGLAGTWIGDASLTLVRYSVTAISAFGLAKLVKRPENGNDRESQNYLRAISERIFLTLIGFTRVGDLWSEHS